MSIVSVFLSVQGLFLVHELGHLLAVGARARVLSLGVGKPIVTWRPRADGLVLQLGWVPVGAYVELAGDLPPVLGSEVDKGSKTAFHRLPAWRRACYCLGGPAANLVLALVLAWWCARPEPWTPMAALAGLGEAVQWLWILAGSLFRLAFDTHSWAGGGPLYQLAVDGKYSAGLATGSLTIGLLNLLPVPSLDGGGLLLIGWEAVAGRMSNRWMYRLVVGGASFLIALLLSTFFLAVIQAS